MIEDILEWIVGIWDIISNFFRGKDDDD